MDRRLFIKTTALVGGAAAVYPQILMTEEDYPPSLNWFTHLSQYDDKDDIIITAVSAVLSLTDLIINVPNRLSYEAEFDKNRPSYIFSSSRVSGHIFHRLKDPVFKKHRNPTFMFLGAVWISQDYYPDDVVLIKTGNQKELRNPRLNGWYRFSEKLLDNPDGDRYFEDMTQRFHNTANTPAGQPQAGTGVS